MRGKLKDIEVLHVEEVLGLLEKPAGKEISLPYGIKAVKRYDGLLLLKGHAVLSNAPEMPGLTLTLLDRKEDEGIPKNLYTEMV